MPVRRGTTFIIAMIVGFLLAVRHIEPDQWQFWVVIVLVGILGFIEQVHCHKYDQKSG